MHSHCPRPRVWASWILEPEAAPHGRHDAILAHLAACPACRAEVEALVLADVPVGEAEALASLREAETLRCIREVAAPRPAVRGRVWALAAAGLLLAAAGWSRWRAAVAHPPAPSSALPPRRRPAAEPTPLPSPGGLWQGGSEAHAVLGRSVAASLQPGGVLRWAVAAPDGLGLCLEAGELWLDSPGEAVSLSVGGLSVSLGDAELMAQATPELFLKVSRGAVRVQGAGEAPLEVPAGCEVRLDASGRAVLGSGGAPPRSGWIPLGVLPGGLKDGTHRFGVSPQGDYRFEVLVGKRSSEAECAVGFVAGGASYEIPLGSALEGAREGWTRVAVEVRRGWCRAVVGSRLLVSCPVSDLGTRVYPRAMDGLRVKAWGGDVMLGGARWRT